MAEQILVVDDDENLQSMVAAGLRHHGFDVRTADDGEAALAEVARWRPSIIVLDVMMPGIDGFEVCRRLRSIDDATPVLFLTARGETDDKVHGLRLGADDYLEKPFRLDELVARLEAVTRRSASPRERQSVELADLRLDEDGHRVYRSGSPVHLTPTEYQLLRYLLWNQGRVLSKTQILDHVWPDQDERDGGVVETFIGYLRRKVDVFEPKLIHTVRGVGYTMRVEK